MLSMVFKVVSLMMIVVGEVVLMVNVVVMLFVVFRFELISVLFWVVLMRFEVCSMLVVCRLFMGLFLVVMKWMWCLVMWVSSSLFIVCCVLFRLGSS